MTFSKMMLGTVQFGLNYGIANREGQPSVEKVKGILRLANELGINTLDTAAAYGTSEEVLGQALKETGLSDRFQIITKIPVFSSETSEKEAEAIIRDSLTRSLQRLHRDRRRRSPDRTYQGRTGGEDPWLRLISSGRTAKH